MKRYFIQLSYNGTSYFGWQRQSKQHSVQEEIENALSKWHSNTPITIVGCGRTDSGVHAKQYFCHTDLPEECDTTQLINKLNRMLPPSIAIHTMEEVTRNQHARFDAKKRTYRYFIHQQKEVFLNDTSWYFPKPLNIEKMNQAARFLLGKQDFTSLSKLHTDVKTNLCEVFSAEWVQTEQGIYFEISADRFLRNMVRATVGTLLEIGMQRIQPDELISILAKKDRQAAYTSVPAHGLFLWKVEY